MTKMVGWLAAAFSMYVLFITSQQIREDLADRVDERQVRRDERLERAWVRLREPVGGATGKGAALNIILEDASFWPSSLDLSCRAVGDFDKENNKCADPPIFENVIFSKRKHVGDLEFDIHRLNDAIFVNANMEGVSISVSGMINTIFIQSNFSGSDWYYSDLQTKPFVKIRRSDLSFAKIFVISSNIDIKRSNISQMEVKSSGLLSVNPDEESEINWAWADYPPVLSSVPASEAVAFLSKVRLCDPKYRSGEGEAAAKGHVPSYFEKNGWIRQDEDCPSMSYEDAKENFPDKYRFSDG